MQNYYSNIIINKTGNAETPANNANGVDIGNNNVYIFRKRIRKRKCDIERCFKCPIPDCDKSYGSENSMNQHLKLKHSPENLT